MSLKVSTTQHDVLLFAANAYQNSAGVVMFAPRGTENALIRRGLITYDTHRKDNYPVITVKGWAYLSSAGFNRRAEDPGRLDFDQALAQAYPTANGTDDMRAVVRRIKAHSAPTPKAAADPSLSVHPGPTLLDGILRADKIRHDTLVQLVQHWGVEQARLEIIDQLDALAEAVCSPREPDGELDALIQNVEDAAAMDDAEITLGLHTMRQLRSTLTDTISAVDRFGHVIGATP